MHPRRRSDHRAPGSDGLLDQDRRRAAGDRRRRRQGNIVGHQKRRLVARATVQRDLFRRDRERTQLGC